MRVPPPGGYQLRDAARADSPAVRELVFRILAGYGLAPDPAGVDADLADLEAAYRPPEGWFVVLCDPEARIVGSAGFLQVDPGTVELRKMYLDPGHRGRGLGRFLLRSALDEARARGFRRLTLETAAVLKEALVLYERSGFVRLPVSPHVCRCDIVMELRLEGPPGACVA